MQCARNGGNGRPDNLQMDPGGTESRSNDSEKCKIAILRKITQGSAADQYGIKRVTKIVTGNSETGTARQEGWRGGIIFESRYPSVITLPLNIWGPHFGFRAQSTPDRRKV